ncbi:MAG: thioredoxin-like domain-containing protein [Phycisphaerales bacterium]|nr:thioredoxin-like domain-containing protein [Phycisphaerales bacterium]
MSQILAVAVVLLLSGSAVGQGQLTGSPGTTADVKPEVKAEVKPEVQAVLDAFIEATGGEQAYRKLGGLYRRYQWAAGDDSGKIEVRARPGGAFSLDMTMDGSEWHEGQASDGTKTWQEDAAGVCFPAADSVAILLQMEQDPTALVDLKKYARAMTVSGEVTVANLSTWKVIVVPKAGRPWYLFFDIETGLLNRMEFSRPGADGRPIMVDRSFHDWKSAGSIKVPGVIRERSLLGSVVMTLKAAEVAALPASEFVMTPCAQAAFNPPDERTSPPDVTKLPVEGAYHTKLIKMIGPTLVTSDGQSVSSSILADQPDVLLYFTAKWCGPCRRFTPTLVDFYKKHAGDRDFMIVMVSSDREKAKMSQYMTDYKIDFPAVPFDRRDSSGLKTAWGGRGIPNLVWLDGQDEVVKGSYEKGRYVGPASVLGSFKKHLAVE